MTSSATANVKRNTLINNELYFSDTSEIEGLNASLQKFKKSLSELGDLLDKSEPKLKELTKCLGLTYNEETFKVQNVASKEWDFPEMRKNMTEIDAHLKNAKHLTKDIRSMLQTPSDFSCTGDASLEDSSYVEM